jgi:hypothetical protein
MYLLTQPQVNQIKAAAEDPNATHPFSDMYSLIYEFLKQPDEKENSVAGNVFAWFGAAAQANRGVGGASDFINAFTESQLVIRTGAPVSGVDSRFCCINRW